MDHIIYMYLAWFLEKAISWNVPENQLKQKQEYLHSRIWHKKQPFYAQKILGVPDRLYEYHNNAHSDLLNQMQYGMDCGDWIGHNIHLLNMRFMTAVIFRWINYLLLQWLKQPFGMRGTIIGLLNHQNRTLVYLGPLSWNRRSSISFRAR